MRRVLTTGLLLAALFCCLRPAARAGGFAGAGEYLWMKLDISQINASGSRTSSTYLRGDATWAVPPGTGGTVTSVGLGAPSQYTVSGSPVTGSGTLSFAWNSVTANYGLLGPTSGLAAVPTFRALVPADYPVFVASGTSHAAGAVPDPGGSAATTHYLREDATWVIPPNSGGTVTSIAAGAGISVSPSPITGTGTVSANPDGSTLDTSGAGSSLEIKALGVGSGQIAASAVTTAKIAPSATIGQVLRTTVASTTTAWSADDRPLFLTLDGGGAVVSAGWTSAPVYCPFALTITGWYLGADVSGSIQLDIWVNASAVPTVTDTIVASAPPKLTSAQTGSDTTLTGWSKSIAAGSWLIIKVTSASTVTKTQLVITASHA